MAEIQLVVTRPILKVMEIRVKLDSRGLKRFNDAMKDQFPFATARALTVTAGQAKDEVIKQLPKYFTIRNTFTKRGIMSERAEKKDWPNSKATVGSISPYMVVQEEGGAKSPAGKAFSIPKGIRRKETSLVPRSKWPGKILPSESTISGGGRSKGAKSGSKNKPKAFLLREHDGVGVYIRRGKGRRLKRLYRLTKSTVHIKGRHWLESPVTTIVRSRLHHNFITALDEALK